MATFQPVSRCSLRRLHPSIFQLQILTALASTAEQRNRGRGRGRGRTMTKTLGESSKATAYQSPTTTTTAVIDRIPILFKAGLDRCYFDAAARPYLSENMDYAFGSGDVKVEYSSNNNNNGPTTTTTTTTKTPLEHVMQIVGANSRWKPLSIVLDRMPRLGFKWGVDAVNWSIKQQQHEISIQLKKTEHDGDTHSTPSPSSLMDLEKAGLVLAGIRKSQGLEPNALTYSLILNALNKRAATTMKDTTASNHHQNQLVQFYTQYLLGYSSEVSSSSPSASTSSLPSPSIINEFHLKPVIANLARQGHVYHIITTILPLTAARCPHINYTSCSEIVPVLIDGILFAASSSNDGLVLKSLVSSSSSSGGVGLRNKVDVLEFVDMECSWYLQQEQHQQHGHIIHSLLLACYCHCLQQIQSCKPTITTTASPPPQNLNHHQLWISRINTLWNQISKKYGHPSWQDYAAMIPIVISQHSTTTFSTSSPLDTDYSQPPLSNLPRMHEFISEIRQRSSVSRNNKEYFTAHIYPLLIQQ